MPSMSVKGAVEVIRKVQAAQNDMIILISGFRGVGKSTLMMQIAREYLGDNYWTEEGFRKYNIYSRKEFEKKLQEFPETEPLCVDEGINLLFKREFQNKDQNNLIKMFNTYRDKRFLVFILLPNFWDLDSSVRNSTIIKWWVFCQEYGKGLIFQAEDNPFNRDCWNEKDNLIAWRRKVPIYSLPNYYANIYWDEMPKDTYDIYKKVKAEKRAQAYSKQEDTRINKTELIRQMLSINPLINSQVLADATKTTRQLVNQIKKSKSDKEGTSIYILPDNEDV